MLSRGASTTRGPPNSTKLNYAMYNKYLLQTSMYIDLWVLYVSEAAIHV